MKYFSKPCFAVNQHDGKPLLILLDKTKIEPGTRIHADKAYCSQKHREALKARGIQNGIQDKAVKNRPLTQRQLQRNSLISKARYVVERTFGSSARWLGAEGCVTGAKPKRSLAYFTSYGIQPKKAAQIVC